MANMFLDKTLGLARGYSVIGEDGKLEVRYRPQRDHCAGSFMRGWMSDDQYIHAAVLTTVGQEAAWWAVGNDHAVTVQMEARFVRRALLSEGEIVGRGVCLQNGSRIMQARGEVYQKDRLVAVVTASFVESEKRV